MNLKDFKHDDWVKIYDGKWSFLTSTHFIDQYRDQIRFGGRPFKSQSIIFVAHGRSNGWMRQSDRDALGNYLSQEIAANPKSAKVIAAKLKSQAKSYLKFIDKHENTSTGRKLYEEFWRRLLAYYHPHINVKYVVDYLRPDLLKKYLPDLESARLAAESVLNRTEDFMIGFAKLLAKQTGYNYKLLLCLTKEELNIYFAGGKLPAKPKLKIRDKKSALLGDRKGYKFFVANSVAQIEKLVSQPMVKSLVKGSTAFGGKVKGVVRIVLDPNKVKVFNQGDILVTGATRPEFLPIMAKAAAFVTDAGGILSHAAITAREMKKPCVIGTKFATKVFKDGDLIEVDATKGVVQKI